MKRYSTTDYIDYEMAKLVYRSWGQGIDFVSVLSRREVSSFQRTDNLRR